MDVFYDKFIISIPEVAEKFVNTDIKVQKLEVRESLLCLVHFFATKKSDEYMDQLGYVHSKKSMDIHPELYQLWINCLLATLREYDPKFDETVELSWRIVLAPGIEFMKFHYDK